MSAILEQLRQRSRTASKRVIFPETTDPRVREAIRQIAAEAICQPVILAPHAELDDLALDSSDSVGPDNINRISSINSIEVLSEQPNADEIREQAALHLAKRRAHKGMTIDEARNALANDPLLLSACLVGTAYVDTGVAGSIATTPDVIRACLLGIGTAPDSALISSTFLIDHPDRLMTYGDCGVNPDPDAKQLAHIALDSARTHQLLTGQLARVAMLSFSTYGSAKHPSVDKVLEALEIAKTLAPELAIDGELQGDAALIPEIGQRKAPESAVAGHANVLIFPDLNAGNIAYKLTERLGGATAIGPILQGLAKPWMDFSRGCSVDDIVNGAAIASVLAL